MSPRAKALGAGLKEARESRKLGVRELARRLDISHATLSRYESGVRWPTVEDVAVILGSLGIANEQREQLLALARDPDRSKWVSVGMTEQQRQLATLLDYEAIATRVVGCAPLLVPGLLQTGGYTRAIMKEGGVPADEIEMRVATRIGRREALTRPDPVALLALIGEGVLRQQIGGHEVMAAQLDHLLAMAELPNVEIRLIPIHTGWTPAHEGPFVMVEPAEGRPVVHIESRRSGLFLHEPADIDAYQTGVETLLSACMSAEESAVAITREAEGRRS